MAKLPKFIEDAAAYSDDREAPVSAPKQEQTGKFPATFTAIKDFKGQFNRKVWAFKVGDQVVVPNDDNYKYLKSFGAIL